MLNLMVNPMIKSLFFVYDAHEKKGSSEMSIRQEILRRLSYAIAISAGWLAQPYDTYTYIHVIIYTYTCV